MKRIVSIFVWLLWSAVALADGGMGPGPGTPHSGLVQAAVAAVSAGTGTVTLNGVNSADTLIAFTFISNGAADVPSGAPTGFTAANSPAQFFGQGEGLVGTVYYRLSPPSGTNSVTISYTNGGSGKLILVEWSGLTVTPLDVASAPTNTSTAGTSGSNSVATGPLGSANEVIFAFMYETTAGAGSVSTGANLPATGGFTDIVSSANSSTDFLYDLCYKVVNTTASITAGWTWTDTAGIISQSMNTTFVKAP